MASLPTRMRGKGGGGDGRSGGGSETGSGQQGGDGRAYTSPVGRLDNPYFSEKSPFDPVQFLPKGTAGWENALHGWIAYVKRSRHVSAFVVAAVLHLALSVILQAESATVRGGLKGLTLFILQLPVGLFAGGTLAGAALVGAPALITSAPQIMPWLHVALTFVANEWVTLDHTLSDAPGGRIHLSSQDNCPWPCFRGLKRAFWGGKLGLFNLLLVVAFAGVHSAFRILQEQKGGRSWAGMKGGRGKSNKGSGGHVRASPRSLKVRMGRDPTSPMGGNESDKDQPGSFKLGSDHDQLSPITYNARMEKLMAQKARGGRASTPFEIFCSVVLGWLCVSILSTGISLVQRSAAVSGWVGHPVGAPMHYIVGVRSVRDALGVDKVHQSASETVRMDPPVDHKAWGRNEEHHPDAHEDVRHARDLDHGIHNRGGAHEREAEVGRRDVHEVGERHEDDRFHRAMEGRPREGAHHEGGPAVHHPVHHDPATKPAGDGGFLELGDEWEAEDWYKEYDHGTHEDPLYAEKDHDWEHEWDRPDRPAQYVHPEDDHKVDPADEIHHGDHFDYEAGEAWEDFDGTEDEENWEDVDWEHHHIQNEDGTILHDPTKEESHGEGGHDPDFDTDAAEKEKAASESRIKQSADGGDHEGEEEEEKPVGKGDADAELVKKVYWPMYADMDMEKETEEELLLLTSAVRKLREHCTKKQANIVVLSIDSLSSHRTPGSTHAHIFDPIVAPNLHSLEVEHGIKFPEMYVPVASSMSTAVFVATGGVGPLSIPMIQERGRYRGTTLPRVMYRMGWRTAYVSAEDTRESSLNAWLRHQSYHWIATRDTKPELFEDDMSQWGGTDDAAVDAAIKFANETALGKPPFFVQLNLHATRHPYAVPRTWTSSLNETLEGETYAHVPSMIRFRRALHYTDHAVGRLIAGLKKLDLLDNTLFVLTSNHGEAFGDMHEGNFLHGSFLFEENVKSFMIIAHPNPQAIPHPVEVRNRPASVGDIFPTLMDVIGGPIDGRLRNNHENHEGRIKWHEQKWHTEDEPSDPWGKFAADAMLHDPIARMVLQEDGRSGHEDDDELESYHVDIQEVAPVRGRSLVTPKFEWRTIFFYKRGIAPQWGLRDGRWKFVGHRHHKDDELYDVVADPFERLNLAKHYANQTHQQVDIFHSRCDRWFDYIECAWMAHGACFRSYDQSDSERRVAERKERAQQRFPIYSTIGTGHGKKDFVAFPNRHAVPPGLQVITVAVHWKAFPHPRVLYFDLASAAILNPMGIMHTVDHRPCWDQATMFPGACTSIHGGNERWQVAFLLEDGWDASWLEIAVGGELTSGDWAIAIWAEDGVTRLATIPFSIAAPPEGVGAVEAVQELPKADAPSEKVSGEGALPTPPPPPQKAEDSQQQGVPGHEPAIEGKTEGPKDAPAEDGGKKEGGAAGGDGEKGSHGTHNGTHGDEAGKKSGHGKKGLVACGPPYEVHLGMLKNGESQEFVEVDRYHPMQQVITVQVRWPPCGVNRNVNYFFTSRLFPIPAWMEGTALNHTVEHKFRTTWFWWKPDRPIAVDQWQLLVMEGNRVLARKPFFVDTDATVLF